MQEAVIKPLITDLQYVIIKLMITDELICQKAALYLEADYFNNKYLSWLFTKSKKYFEEYKRCPSLETLLNQINAVVEKEEAEHYLQSLDRVKAAETHEREYIIDELEKFIKVSEFKKLHIKSAEFFNGGEQTKAFDYTRKQMEKIDTIRLKHDDYVTPEEIDNIIASKGMDVEEIDIFGMEFEKWENRDTWNGKIPKQGVSTVIAPWNVGKTTFLINCIYHAAASGKKVLFVFHEGRKADLVRKILARITGIPTNAIVAGILNEEEHKKIGFAKELIKNFIRIKQITKVGNTVEELAIYCKSVRQEYKFDLLVDDYAMKLGVKSGKRELRHDYLQIWNTLDQVAHELNVAVLTAAQVNRDGSEKNKKGSQILRSENISETIAPAQISEYCFTLNRSADDKIADSMIICLDKTRSGLDGLLIEVKTMFSRSITHDKRLGIKIIGFDTGEGREAGH